MVRPAPFSTQTSGDLTADRRYAYGDGALGDGDFVAARDLFAQTLELAPGWPPAYLALAKACLALGDQAAAAEALRQACALDPEDRLGAGVLLAQISGEPVMPDAYVAGLFDEYAGRFDSHLVGALDYRAPEMLKAMLQHGDPLKSTMSEVLDLGCGTGLMARALGGSGMAFTGVDLSAGMLAVAQTTGLYRRLACAELLAFLMREPDARYDLVIAADVFCYVPDLAPVFVETRRVLRSGGRFAFSIQTHSGAGVIIGDDCRVHHAPRQVHDWAAAAELDVRQEIPASTRRDRGIPVPGALFELAKP